MKEEQPEVKVDLEVKAQEEETKGSGDVVLVAEAVQRNRVTEWLAGVMEGVRATRGLCDWPFNQGPLDGPQPPGLDELLLTAPESPGHTLRWCLHEAHWRLWKEGRWAWEDERTGGRIEGRG